VTFTEDGLPRFVLEPGHGVEPVRFGMTREQVAEAMARAGGNPPRAIGAGTAGYFDGTFRVSFGDEGRVDFIEFASRLDGELLFDGRDVFDVPAEELVQLVSQHDAFAPELSRPPGEYTFPDLILTLWGAAEQYDHKGGRRRRVWAAVGLGAPTYLAAVRAIRAGRPG
jgi:hypothetical protein